MIEMLNFPTAIVQRVVSGTTKIGHELRSRMQDMVSYGFSSDRRVHEMCAP